MRDIQALFADYASHHQTKGNKVFHRVGIPLIMLTLLGMLARVPVYGPVTAGILLVVVAEVVYLKLEWRRAPCMLVIPGPIYFGARGGMPPWRNVTLFLVRAVLQ